MSQSTSLKINTSIVPSLAFLRWTFPFSNLVSRQRCYEYFQSSSLSSTTPVPRLFPLCNAVHLSPLADYLLNCVMSTMCAQHWNVLVELDQYSKEEIIFWRKNVSSVKSWHCFLTKTPQIFAYSDASATGCRSIVSLDKEQIRHRLWVQSETSKNSTWRELAATDFGIESFGPIFEGTRVKLFTVNQAAAKIVEIGRMRFNIHILAMSIFNVALNDS